MIAGIVHQLTMEKVSSWCKSPESGSGMVIMFITVDFWMISIPNPIGNAFFTISSARWILLTPCRQMSNPSSMETPSSTTDAKILHHMNNNPADCGRWLLVKPRNIDKINELICHLSTVLGVKDDTALQASSCWLNGQKVKIPHEGLVVDETTGLRVFRATSSPEIFGSKAAYLAFGTTRPALTVAQQYLQPRSPTSSSSALYSPFSS